jgi:hypothetical protein
MIGQEQNQLIGEAVSKLEKLAGVNYIYFLSRDLQTINEKKITGNNNYLDQVKNILGSEELFKKVQSAFYEKEFHTFTLLNESGLIIISKLGEYLYLVVIAGENEPVDLINLLKTCKESRKKFNNN